MKLAIADGRESLVQWDTGRYVTVDGASVTEIHFAHPGDTSPVTVPVRDGRAAIPDTLLETGMSVIAYAHAADGTGSYTVEERVFPVRRRPKPDGYIYTPAEKRTLEALEARVAALEALSVAVEGAKAGQLLKIAAVDESGKPTAYAAEERIAYRDYLGEGEITICELGALRFNGEGIPAIAGAAWTEDAAPITPGETYTVYIGSESFQRTAVLDESSGLTVLFSDDGMDMDGDLPAGAWVLYYFERAGTKELTVEANGFDVGTQIRLTGRGALYDVHPFDASLLPASIPAENVVGRYIRLTKNGNVFYTYVTSYTNNRGVLAADSNAEAVT